MSASDFPPPLNPKNEWWTPPAIIEAARASMGGIDLDPASCAEAQETVRADRWIGLPDDGLAHPWSGKVWLNPPWSEPGRWCDYLLSQDVDAAVFLGPLSAANWVQRLWRDADAVVWIRGTAHSWAWGGPGAEASRIGRPWTWGIVAACIGDCCWLPMTELGAAR